MSVLRLCVNPSDIVRVFCCPLPALGSMIQTTLTYFLTQVNYLDYLAVEFTFNPWLPLVDIFTCLSLVDIFT